MTDTGLTALGVTPDFRALTNMLDTLPVGAYTCDASGQITYYNEPAVKAWGRAPELNSSVDQWCGSFRLYNARTGEPIPHDACWMALAIKNNRPYNSQEIEIERPDGTRWTALAHANPIRDRDGNLAGAVNVLIDITDRKRATDALARLAAIVENSDDAIYSKSLEGRIQSWNRGAERLFGYQAEEAIGAPITLIVPPEEREAENRILGRIGAGERVGNFETVRVAKDGRRLQVSLTISPVRTGDGRVIGISSVARDITERKLEERGFRLVLEMSGRLAGTFDRSIILQDLLQTAVAIQGADFGLASLVNPDDGALQLGAHHMLPPDFVAAVQRVLPGTGACGLCLVRGERVVIEDTAEEPALQPYLAQLDQLGIRSVHCTPLSDPAGRVIGVVSTHFRRRFRPSRRESGLVDLAARFAMDFLDRARLYAELQEMDKAKNRFLAILSHELRNPLAPIRSAVETVHLTAAGMPELAQPLSVMDRQIAQMARLIDDLLDISRITNNKLNLRREPVELSEVLRAAVEVSRPAMAASDHELRVELPAQPVWIDADPTRMAQVLSNLLNNAGKYTPESGRITISAQQVGQEAVIQIRDNGVGIPPSMLTRVFEMFTQVEDGMNRTRGGLGIGLTLAQRLVDMHGGTISAESEGSGKGSQFTVRLPVIPAPAVREASPAAAPVRRAARNPLRIMIVDDNRDAADSLGALLSIHGHQIKVAYDSREALDGAGEFHPQVMLLDIGLPGLNGYETAQQVRQHPWGRNLLLIAVTGWGQEEAKRRSWEAGFDSHLVKPVDPSVLVDLLGTLQSARK